MDEGCSTEREVVLRADGLVKQYKRVRAVDGIALSVAAGERVALLGPNGAGKTTTLMMLLGVITPDEGSIEIAGWTHTRPLPAPCHGRQGEENDSPNTKSTAPTHQAP